MLQTAGTHATDDWWTCYRQQVNMLRTTSGHAADNHEHAADGMRACGSRVLPENLCWHSSWHVIDCHTMCEAGGLYTAMTPMM